MYYSITRLNTSKMKTTEQWITHFQNNALQQRVNWKQQPVLSAIEKDTIGRSLQAWQLGETSDGSHLLKAATAYATKFNDPAYVEAVKLFIKEEQKHGNNLGTYLDRIGVPRVKKDWGDTLFRKIRYLNSNIELWTLAVITVESTAQLFYQSMRDATGCALLKQVCSDILIDEAYHIDFQTERLRNLFRSKTPFWRAVSRWLYYPFFFSTAIVVWLGHRKLLTAGGNTFEKYMYRMKCKYNRIAGRVFKTRTLFQYHSISSYPHVQ
ncbi:hypothetical protein SAMN05421788_11857 [Filimonas lacunae]|uniref:Ferritin-like domain-containing protein n=2 Tax=Filimonas lacunae TaxID=477680 RepID=A0A1N7RHS8_9BACT|nr:hypothetical protein SAMN05421788_11857 [Filimonas lacunae]